MSTSETKLTLAPEFFGPAERPLLESGELTATTFRFDSGVSALRLSNRQGELVMLPYQGQQIWSASFGGRNLTMKSMFDQPKATQAYLETYGGFLLHCGATAMGVPTAEDTHPLHGELPNAPFQQAWVVVGEDDRGQYIGLGGEYRHTVAFRHNYLAHSLVKLYAGESRCTIDLTVTNLKATPMEFMYLAHINFRPVDHGKLIYSAPADPAHVQLRKSIPSHVKTIPGYREFMAELEQEPDKHHVLKPGLAFDPEIVFTITYLADADGWAHTLQVHPDGSADYVAHRPDQLDKGVRWICRTPDQDAIGIILPATAGAEGYTTEKAKGNIKVIPAGGSYTCNMEAGVMDAAAARQMAAQIEAILAAA
jgi:hypothetical protein